MNIHFIHNAGKDAGGFITECPVEDLITKYFDGDFDTILKEFREILNDMKNGKQQHKGSDEKGTER